MNLKYSSTLSPASNIVSPVKALAYSPNSKRLLAANQGKTLKVFDDQGRLIDSFQPKLSEKVYSFFYKLSLSLLFFFR